MHGWVWQGSWKGGDCPRELTFQSLRPCSRSNQTSATPQVKLIGRADFMNASQAHHPRVSPLLVAIIWLQFNGTVIIKAAENWPQFRGPNSSGVAHRAKPPIKISPTNHLLWKTE